MAQTSPDQAAAPSRLRRVLVWAVVCSALVAYVAVFRQTYIDDAYITLQYARTLATDLTWGFYPGYPANTATSPLNVVVLALAGLPFAQTVDAVLWVTAAELALTLLVLLKISRRVTGGPHFGVIAFAGIAANPLLVSTIGLESHLYILLMLVAVECYLGGRRTALGVTLGLLMLARPDGLLFLAVMLVLTARRGAGRVLLAFLLTVLPWALFSWVWLGSLVPDTLLIKLGQRWAEATFVTGIGAYVATYPVATMGTLLFVPFAPLAAWALRGAGPAAGAAEEGLDAVDASGPRARLAVGGLVAYALLHFAVYAALDVPPYHWYYTHQVVPAILCGALGMVWLGRRLGASRPTYAPAALPVIALVAALLQTGLHEAPVHTNWASPREYRAVGEEVRDLVEPSAVVDLHGEIGTVAYYSERLVVDSFADPNRVNTGIGQFTDRLPPALSWLSTLNFAWRTDGEPFAAPSYALLALTRPDPDAAAELGPPAAAWNVSSHWAPHTRIFLYRYSWIDMR